MDKMTYSGPIPNHLDVRLERRDTNPLPPKALIKFQFINRGVSTRYNYRWVLYEDGRLFVAWHSDNLNDVQIPFDTELPTTPTRRLNTYQVNQVKEQLQKANLLAQPPYQADDLVEDGSFYIITTRIDGKEVEVIYEAVYPPLVEFLATIASTD